MSDRSAIIFPSLYEALQYFDEKSKLEFLEIVIRYQLYNEEFKLSDYSAPAALALFTAVKPNIDKAMSRYDASVENGKKGGRPKKNQRNPIETQSKPSETQLKAKQNLSIDTDIYTSISTSTDISTNTSTDTVLDSDDFKRFWIAYPRHAAKEAAYKAFEKHIAGKIDIETVIAAIAAQKHGEQWKRDSGQYIPYPATWINQHRWEDEITAAPAAPATKPSGDRTAEVEEMIAELERQRLI